MANINKLNEQFAATGQTKSSLLAERIYRLEEGEQKFKVRIRIKSDSYDFQSYAIAEVYSPHTLSWNELDKIPYGNMRTPAKLAYKTGATIKEFEGDFDTLLERAKIILFD